jgi:Fe-S oxidoreductase
VPKLNRRAIVHGHCHQKALDALNDKVYGEMFAEKKLMDAVGVEHIYLDAGCCGMNGAFGSEAESGHYDLAIACGERTLLPEVRDAPEDTPIVPDGFSCQGQVDQATDRRALHLAQVLQMAIQHGPLGVPGGGRPEQPFVEQQERDHRLANRVRLARRAQKEIR